MVSCGELDGRLLDAVVVSSNAADDPPVVPNQKGERVPYLSRGECVEEESASNR